MEEGKDEEESKDQEQSEEMVEGMEQCNMNENNEDWGEQHFGKIAISGERYKKEKNRKCSISK